MSARVALTGADGYIGSRLERRLRADGREVLRLVRRSRDANDVLFHLGETVDPERLRGVDALIHCAHDFSAVGVNIEGSAQLVAAARTAGVRRIVFVSSVSAFPGCRSEYGLGKLAVEDLVLKSGGAVVRPGLTWGEPGRGTFGALERLAGLPLLPVFDGGTQPFVLSHVDDVAQTLSAAVDWKDADLAATVVAAHPRPVAFRDILLALARARGRSLRTISLPGIWGLAGLRMLEALGLPAPFRSDSLVAMLHPDPSPDFSATRRLGLNFRDFSIEKR